MKGNKEFVSFSKAVEETVLNEFPTVEKTIIEEDEYYSHPTYIIENVWDYIHLVSIISAVNEYEKSSDSVIFRGTSNCKYSLLPGLARLEKPSEVTETELINEFLTRRPDAFRGLSNFDTIAKMQHYGLPTRLLDFSTNPLVALYFACENMSKTDGRVVCHNTFLQNDSSPFVSAICSTAAKKSFDARHWIDLYLKGENISTLDYLREAYLYKETIVVRPKYWNQRIANQAGVFMVFQNELRDRYLGALVHADGMCLADAIDLYGIGEIDEDLLKEIIDNEPIEYYKQHEDFFISYSSFQKIYESYSVDGHFLLENKNKKYFENRFLSSYYLKELREDTIREDCCSIIIEGKNKKRILEELSSIGITNDYIYPELEYTAKEIKRKFHI